VKAKEYRVMTKEELEKQLNDSQESGLKLRFRRATGQAIKTDQFKKLRRATARIQTILREIRG